MIININLQQEYRFYDEFIYSRKSSCNYDAQCARYNVPGTMCQVHCIQCIHYVMYIVCIVYTLYNRLQI